MFHLRVVPCIQNFKIFPKLGPRFQIKKSPKHPVARGIYCPIIRTRGGGLKKICTFGVFLGRKPVPKKFPRLLGKNEAFFEFFEKL